VVYGGLVGWLANHLQATAPEWAFTLAHLALAGAINAHLIRVARRRSLSFLGSAPLAFLVVLHFYFTLSGIRYFSPILLYPQFELSLGAQFAGSVAAAVVLFTCAIVLGRQQGPTTARMQAWVSAHWADIGRLMITSVFGSIACKLLLHRLGYGSLYTGSLYTENAVRSYWDFPILLANDIFGVLSVTFGLMYLMRRGGRGRRPMMFLVAAMGVLLQGAYVLLYLKARMILLTVPISFALVAEVVSRRRAERLLQALLLVMPMLSLLGVQLTLLIGRFNVPEDTGLRLAIGTVNRRADLTDFATAMMVNSRGEAHDASIVPMAILNAIPRAVFPGKASVVRDVYTEVLEQRLGWPAGSGEDLLADYLDTAFSNGVMAFGVVGFFMVPVALVWLWGLASAWLDRRARGLAYGLTLIPVWLGAMHIEGEWSWIPLNFRQAVFYAVICLGLAVVGRLVHEVLAVASLPPPLVAAAGRGAESSTQ
jgi:hypothetical protein